MEKYVDKGKLEKKRLYKLLHLALLRNDDLPELLTTFYDLYRSGYGFLDILGLEYGLAVKVTRFNAIIFDYWEELDARLQKGY